MFTVEQIQEIACKLEALSRRDSQLPPARIISGDELLALLQDGENRLAHIADVIDAINRTILPLMQSEVKLEAFKAWCRSNMVMCAQLFSAVGKYIRGIEGLGDRLETIGILYDETVSAKDSLKESLDKLRNVTLTVVPTPSDATVYIDGVETKTITKCIYKTVHIVVEHEGYVTYEDDWRLTDDTELEVVLEKIKCGFTIMPYPEAAEVKINGSVVVKTLSVEGVQSATVTAEWGDTVIWEVSCDEWFTKSGSLVIKEDTELHVLLENDLLERMKKAEARLDTVESRLDTIDSEISQMQSDITNIQGDITNIQGDINNIQGDITNIEGNITDITNEMTNITGDITDITNNITNLTEEITNITQTTENIEELLEGKQDKLEAGYGINIDGNVISVTIDTSAVKVVTELPAQPDDEDKDKIFLVPSSTATEGNVYDEYIWTDGNWELLGKNVDIPEVDLSDYYTKEEVDEKFEDVEVDLSDYYTKEEVDEKIDQAVEDIEKLTAGEVDEIWDGVENEDFGELRSILFNVSPSNAALTVNGVKQKLLGSGSVGIEAYDGDVIVWSCECEGYVSQNGTFTVSGDAIINISLEEDEGNHEISVTPSSLEFTAASMMQNVIISSDGAWTANVAQDWIGLSETEGESGDTSVNVECLTDTESNRSSLVTFINVYGNIATLSVIQNASTSGGGHLPDPADTIESNASNVRSGQEFTLTLSGTSTQLNVRTTNVSSQTVSDYVLLTINGETYYLYDTYTLISVEPGMTYTCALESNISTAVTVEFKYGDSNVNVIVN